VLLVGAALGARRGLASMALYLALGILGAPVFREGSHGIEKFFSAADDGVLQFAPTGGYLVGMLFAGWIVGRLADLGWDRSVIGTIGAMAIGSLVIYSVGVPWLAASAHLEIGIAIEKGVAPFLLGDAIKLALAAGVFPSAWWYVNHGRSDGPR
jgi:biotin transport system substrate-specific component